MKPNTDSLSPEENTLLESWLNGNKRILMITGAVNSGKSALTKKISGKLVSSGSKVKGFLSNGIFSDGEKTGYKLINISTGDEYHLASTNPGEEFKLQQGRFCFNEKVFAITFNLLKNLATEDILVFDEIGPLEIKEKGFYPSLKNFLNNYNSKIIFVVRESLVNDIIEKFNLLQNEIVILKVKNYKLAIN